MVLIGLTLLLLLSTIIWPSNAALAAIKMISDCVIWVLLFALYTYIYYKLKA